MKNLFRIFAVVAAAAMTFACSDDNGAGVDGFGTHTVTFIAGGDDTRTEIVENGNSVSYKWTAGDEERFHVYENDKAAKTTTVEFSDDYKFATVTATFDNTEAAEFIYTATVAAKLSNAGNPLIPAAQTPAENSFDPAADVLVAAPVTAAAAVTEPVRFRFARVAAVNKATLKGFEQGETVKTVELTSDKQLSQHFTGVDASGEPKYSPNSKTLTLTVDRVVSDGAAAVYFTSAPVESTAFSVRVVTDKNIYTKELALSAEKTLAFTLDRRTGFTVNLAGCGEPIAEDKVYTLVESQDDLYSGATYLIVASNADKYYAMGYQNGTSNRRTAGVDVVNNTISLDNSSPAYVFQIIADGTDYLIQDITNGTDYQNQYLTASGTKASGTNYLSSVKTPVDNSKWTISIENGIASIVNANNKTVGVMGLNGTTLFSCYATMGDRKALSLYVDKTTCVEDTTPRIIASADVVNVSGDGETYDEVTVATKYVEGAVTVTVPAEAEEWIVDAAVEGGKLELLVDKNLTGVERTAVLTLSAEGAESVAITVKQAAIVPEITIAEADKTLSVPAEGFEKVQSINVTTANLTEDVKVTVEPASEWLIADYNAADGTLDIFVEANTDAAERKATVTLSANGVSAAVEVTQAGKSDFASKFFDFTDMSYGSGDAVTSEKQTPIEIAFSLGTNTNGNTPKYYTNSKGNAIRAYTGNTVTVSGGTITQIDITYGSTKSGTTTANPSASFTDASANGTAVWKGSATSVAFTFGGTTWISSIKVTYAGSGEPSGPTQLATPEVTATSTATSVTLSWGGVSGADGYVYKIGDNPEQKTIETSVTVNNLSEGTYAWSVKAISNDPANYTDSELATGSVTVSNGGSTGDQRGDAWTYTFTSATPKLGTAAQTFDGLSWVSSIAANQYESMNDNRGWQFGTAKGTFTVKTSDYKQSINYMELVVSTNGAGNSVSVTVGGKVLGSTVSLSNGDKNRTITFESTELLTGEIVITIKDTAKSVYLKTISINNNN